MARWNSSTERDLVDQLDAKNAYEVYLEELRAAWEERNAKKIQTLLGQFVHLVHAQQVIKLLDNDNMTFDQFVAMAGKLKGDYLVPPKQEVDLGAITFNITRPAIEVEEKKQLPE